MLHHVNVMLPGRRDLFRPIMQRLVAAGEDTDPIELPWPFALRVESGEEFLAYAMLHSEGDTDHGDVFLLMQFHYGAVPRAGVQPFFIDVSPPPGPAGWDLPPGRSTRSWEGSPDVAGRVLGLGGHMHRYGVELILEDVTAGRELHRERPVLAAGGAVLSMPQRTFIGRLGYRLRPDHVYRITAVYDNPTGDTIRAGAMGSIGGVVRTRAGAWPAADPGHPLYIEDLRILTYGLDDDPHGGHGTEHGAHGAH
jgi:hypothetical protein